MTPLHSIDAPRAADCIESAVDSIDNPRDHLKPHVDDSSVRCSPLSSRSYSPSEILQYYVTTSSVNKTDTIEKFQAEVLRAITHNTPGDHLFTHVPPCWGLKCFKELDEFYNCRKTWNSVDLTLRIKTMPAQVHDSHHGWIGISMQRWAVTPNLWTEAEGLLCVAQVGTTIEYTSGPLVGSKKEPDLLFAVNRQKYPTFAIEAGWSESAPRLIHDKDLLFNGAQGDTQVVITIKWRKNINYQVSGSLKVWRWGQASPLEMTIFPRPVNGSLEEIHLSRSEVLGQSIQPGRNASDILPLRLDHLRHIAADKLAVMGLTHT
ncbi:hypothetical protein N7495_010029 [Penicillium taxi]|uniref:uncharacterized protein n=1 Tax=Penicillium taxi TaxID=168475 RepID=UPI00254543CB|nr:uncharacterized protein N7495_010029 [Penicillium taxi]KAJ5885519.1 hypothetical protein N7495_010029 [Penicillium taxi]